jgi:hypothetical protein
MLPRTSNGSTIPSPFGRVRLSSERSCSPPRVVGRSMCVRTSYPARTRYATILEELLASIFEKPINLSRATRASNDGTGRRYLGMGSRTDSTGLVHGTRRWVDHSRQTFHPADEAARCHGVCGGAVSRRVYSRTATAVTTAARRGHGRCSPPAYRSLDECKYRVSYCGT